MDGEEGRCLCHVSTKEKWGHLLWSKCGLRGVRKSSLVRVQLDSPALTRVVSAAKNSDLPGVSQMVRNPHL